MKGIKKIPENLDEKVDPFSILFLSQIFIFNFYNGDHL